LAISIAGLVGTGCEDDPSGSVRPSARPTDAAADRTAALPANEPSPDGAGGRPHTSVDASSGASRDASRDVAVLGRDAGDAGRGAPDARDVGIDASDGSKGGWITPDAAYDGAAPACIVVAGSGTAWPPTTPVSSKRECVPNCDTDQCGSECVKISAELGSYFGAPCDTGCCSGNQVRVLGSGTSNPGNAVRLASVRDSSGTVYALWTDGMHYSETPPSGTGYSISDLDCRDWTVDPFSGSQYCSNTSQGSPRVAVGGPAGDRVVCVAYGEGVASPFPGSTWRFGTKRGTRWAFEDLPMPPGNLVVDPAGGAWMGSGGKLLRRVAPGKWIEAAVPCGLDVYGFAMDENGTMYFATGQKSIMRRSPSGAWGSEATPGVAGGVFVGGGAVHYYRMGTGPTADGSATATLYYGRRAGTTWSEHAVATDPDSLWDVEMQLDACGAPHFIYSIQRSDYTWPVTYVRWTAAGWRSTLVFTSIDPAGPGLSISTSTASATFVEDWSTVGTALIPLR
jgi:hypothetical protein